MYIVGELRDSSVAKTIERIFIEQNVAGKVIPHEDHFVVVAENEDSLKQVDTIYRLNVGLPIRQEMPKEWQNLQRVKMGPMTKTIIVSCVIIFILGMINKPLDRSYAPFFISVRPGSLFSEVMAGEFWRLWTPMLLHFSFLHIFFNLLWVKDIGSALEEQESTRTMIILTLIYGLLTNVAQYLVVGPSFGGMSGVVFAYLGQMWMRAKFDPEVPYSLPKRDIGFMIGWLVLCMTGIIGAIANVAHAIGLACGMIVGIYLTLKSPSKSKKLASSTVLIYAITAIAFSILSILVDWFHNGKLFFFEKFI